MRCVYAECSNYNFDQSCRAGLNPETCQFTRYPREIEEAYHKGLIDGRKQGFTEGMEMSMKAFKMAIG